MSNGGRYGLVTSMPETSWFCPPVADWTTQTVLRLPFGPLVSGKFTTTSIFETPPEVLPSRNLTILQTDQLKRLLDGHEFMRMDDMSPWCLLCFALDHFRTETDHGFVIHEE